MIWYGMPVPFTISLSISFSSIFCISNFKIALCMLRLAFFNVHVSYAMLQWQCANLRLFSLFFLSFLVKQNNPKEYFEYFMSSLHSTSLYLPLVSNLIRKCFFLSFEKFLLSKVIHFSFLLDLMMSFAHQNEYI